jgi:hypothetical protein
MEWTPVPYGALNSRQRENYNYHKVSAALADYGFTTIRLSDDWHGADFIALHIDGETHLRVQLKGRMTFDRKYVGRNLYIAFHAEGMWYIYPHDDLLNRLTGAGRLVGTRSWEVDGVYHFPTLSGELLGFLTPYKLAAAERTNAAPVD